MLGVSKKKVAVRAEQSRKKGAHKETVAEPALQLDMGAFLSALNSMLRATMVERAAFCFRAYDKKNKGEVDRMQIFRMACDRFQATPCSSCAAWDDRAASDRTGIGSGLQTATTDCADGGMRMTAAVECARCTLSKNGWDRTAAAAMAAPAGWQPAAAGAGQGEGHAVDERALRQGTYCGQWDNMHAIHTVERAPLSANVTQWATTCCLASAPAHVGCARCGGTFAQLDSRRAVW